MLKTERLSKHHDRKRFDCGSDALNSYLKKTARQHIDKGIAKTFVIVDDTRPGDILGFFTLVFCEVSAKDLPSKFAKKYPRKVPAAKLARLAVASARQRRGLGTEMMISAMRRILSVSENIGIIGFFVDAENEDAKGYYEQFGFIPLPNDPLKLFLPMATLHEAYAGFSTIPSVS